MSNLTNLSIQQGGKITLRQVASIENIIASDDSILDENGKPDVSKIDPLARLGGRKYASLNEAWDIIRPN